MNMADIATNPEYRAAQDPWELAITLDLLNHHIRPKLILEIGSWWGGTLFAWGSTGAQVISMTLPETRDYLDGHMYGATVLYGNSHDDEAYGRIAAAADGRPVDFAFIDGDHTEDGCRQDFELCLRLKVPVIGFHDIFDTGLGEPGVKAVWDEAKARYPHVEIIRPSAHTTGTGILWT